MTENRLFWPQEMMDAWVTEEQAIIHDDVITLIEDDRKYRLQQAVLFVSDVGDGQDLHNLIGKVKELSIITELGAEHYMDSVIVDDSAYQVIQGFTGIPFLDTVVDAVGNEDISGAVKSRSETSTNADDKELLANFLLNNL